MLPPPGRRAPAVRRGAPRIRSTPSTKYRRAPALTATHILPVQAVILVSTAPLAEEGAATVSRTASDRTVFSPQQGLQLGRKRAPDLVQESPAFHATTGADQVDDVTV